MLDVIPILMGSIVFQLILTTLLLLSFYNYGKKIIFQFSPNIAMKTTVIEQYPLSQIVGVIELTVVAFCHVIFGCLLLFFFKIDIVTIFKNTTIINCFYGILIGIGSVGISILLCTVGMKVLESIAPDKAPKSIDGWMAVANAGWIRHHKHTIKVLPFYLALLIITLQIGSEEVIFRAVLTHIFIPYGAKIALMISTLLFIYMQTLHMPSKTSAMFPVIGATVMGLTHGLIYLENPSIVPLIISHLTFFIFTII
ncbi:MAG: CPBP family intramembrane metalloprotease [Tatlockia sp.]|nr:CPBP family intramembrane metalloprotease [Tatlockia sp.]